MKHCTAASRATTRFHDGIAESATVGGRAPMNISSTVKSAKGLLRLTGRRGPQSALGIDLTGFTLEAPAFMEMSSHLN